LGQQVSDYSEYELLK